MIERINPSGQQRATKVIHIDLLEVDPSGAPTAVLEAEVKVHGAGANPKQHPAAVDNNEVVVEFGLDAENVGGYQLRNHAGLQRPARCE